MPQNLFGEFSFDLDPPVMTLSVITKSSVQKAHSTKRYQFSHVTRTGRAVARRTASTAGHFLFQHLPRLVDLLGHRPNRTQLPSHLANRAWLQFNVFARRKVVQDRLKAPKNTSETSFRSNLGAPPSAKKINNVGNAQSVPLTEICTCLGAFSSLLRLVGAVL